MSVSFEDFTGFGVGGDYMPADTVDEQASDTGMAGYATVSNQRAGAAGFLSMGTPSGSLVFLWFLAMGLYWFMGYTFRRVRA